MAKWTSPPPRRVWAFELLRASPLDFPPLPRVVSSEESGNANEAVVFETGASDRGGGARRSGAAFARGGLQPARSVGAGAGKGGGPPLLLPPPAAACGLSPAPRPPPGPNPRPRRVRTHTPR